MMTSLGERGLPVFQAGQTDWHRPHSVQVAKSSICFQVNCSTSPTPKTVSSVTFSMSMSGVLSRAPSARGRREKATLMGATKMCRCLEYETKTKKPTMTATLRMRKTVSRTLLTPVPRGARALAMPCEAKAHHPYGNLAGVHLGRPVEEEGDHDPSDHQEHQPRRAGVRAVEA